MSDPKVPAGNLGTIVIYHGRDSQDAPAIVTKVNPDGSRNLIVFDDRDGAQHRRQVWNGTHFEMWEAKPDDVE